MNWLVFWVFVTIALFFVFIWAVRYETKKYEKNRKSIEDKLAQAGFNISRCVGRNVGLLETAHYSLYVDDVNKKWVVTLASPANDFMDKIRGFDELVDFVFFDEDADNWATKIGSVAGKIVDTVNSGARSGFTVLGVILGAGLGASIVAGGGGSRVKLGAILGGVLGGVGTSRLAQMQRSQSEESISGAYGVIILTTDSDEHNPVSVYDFTNIDGKAMKSTPMVKRTSGGYKKDIKVIAEMLEVLGQIQRSTS